MRVLHNMQVSGNCYKVRLVARHLQIPVHLIEFPIGSGNGRGLAELNGFDLVRYPAICAWLKGVAEQPGHMTLNQNW